MQIAYFDCFSGISGDMALAALLDAGADLNAIQAAVDSMAVPQIRLSTTHVAKRGFRGRLLTIDHPRQHSHRYLRDVHALIRKARISTQAKDLAMRLFERIARAEAAVHGTTIDRVQFHEIGAIDSIVDIVGVSVAWDLLGIDRAVASPIPTGTGQIQIAHGTVSVPAPATAELLLGVPIAPTQIAMEMTTPTGAAIVTELASEFGSMPPMQVGRIGYGAGRRDMPDRPNLLRVLIGDSILARASSPEDSVLVIESNLDDISPEQIGFAMERLWQAGALDVFTVPIQMKKNRPGTLLTVLAKPEDRLAMESILFQQTGTLGLRYRKQSRTVLPRAAVDVSTPWGIVAGKVSKLPTGEVDFSPEYDDCRDIAAKHGLRWSDVVNEVRECYYASNAPVPRLEADEGDFMEIVPEAPTSDDSHRASQPAFHLPSVNAEFQQAAIEDQLDLEEASTAEETRIDHAYASYNSNTAQSQDYVDRTYEQKNEEKWKDDSLPESSIPPRIEPLDESISESPLDYPSSQDVLSTEGIPSEFYRWDSSPWADDRNAPLPPAKTPEEFPIRRDWE